MFVQDDEVLDIKIYCRKNKNRYMAYVEKEYNALDDKEKAKCTLLTLKMKTLSWGTYNSLQDEAMTDATGTGDRQFSFRIYKELKLKKLIKEWDAKDKDGKAVPINEKSISHLAPAIAETILKAYDDVSMLGEDEEGK